MEQSWGSRIDPIEHARRLIAADLMDARILAASLADVLARMEESYSALREAALALPPDLP